MRLVELEGVNQVNICMAEALQKQGFVMLHELNPAWRRDGWNLLSTMADADANVDAETVKVLKAIAGGSGCGDCQLRARFKVYNASSHLRGPHDRCRIVSRLPWCQAFDPISECANILTVWSDNRANGGGRR